MAALPALTFRLGLPFIRRAAAADTIRIGPLVAKTGQIAPQTEYLAQGTYRALAERKRMIGDRPVDLIWLDEPGP